MTNIAASADHLLTIPPWRTFLMERREAWLEGDDGTAASLPAVLSRQIHPGWIGEDGRFDEAFRDPRSPLAVAFAFHAYAMSDPLDDPCNHYPIYNPKPEPEVVAKAPDEFADLYFIGADEGPIKIGVSVNPVARLKGLQTGYPFKLRLLAVVRGAALQEITYHAQFAEHRLEGEWFSRTPEIEAEIARLVERNEAA